MSLVVPPYPPARYTKDQPEVSAWPRRSQVLSGTMKLYDGRDWIDGNRGDFLFVPPGGVHGFRNEADEPASILMLFAPGAPREAYFEGLAGLADMTDEQRREFFVLNDNFFV